MKIETKFDIEQSVVLKHDREQKSRMVTRIFVSSAACLYECSAGTEVSTHYEFELDEVKNKETAGFLKDEKR